MKKFSLRLKDICRCGHKLEQHDFGVAYEKPCLKANCPCWCYHKKTAGQKNIKRWDYSKNLETKIAAKRAITITEENTPRFAASLQQIVEAAKKIRDLIARGESYHAIRCNYHVEHCTRCNCGVADLESAVAAYEAAPPAPCSHCGAPLSASGQCLTLVRKEK